MASIGQTPGLIIAAGVGAAASVALEPAFEVPRQDAWHRLSNRILDANLLARLTAQGGVVLGDKTNIQPGTAYDHAKRDGYSPDEFDRLIYLAQTVPGFAEVMRLWRLSDKYKPLFDHALVKAQIEPQYYEALRSLRYLERPGLGDIAYGVVRGILPAPAWVPVAPPATGDKVKRFPQVDIDPLTLANEIGFDENMLKLMVGRSGLSMAPVMAAQALFREIIGPKDYLLAIAEGDLRTEWADAVRDASRQILTAGEYAELELRGYYDRATRLKNTRKHGMSDADSDWLYDVQGRAPAIHAVTTGLARGGEYTGKPIAIPEPYLSSVQRGNIRPEWYGIEYANRYTYPSAFVLRTMAEAGELGDAAAVAKILEEIGWPPAFAQKVAQAWVGTGTAVSPYTKKAESQLWTRTHSSYTKREIGATEARARLTQLGVDAAAQNSILALWDAERSMIHAQLSPSQIHKAVKDGVINPATGVAWTMQDGITALLERGYTQADAQVLLSE